MPCVTCGATDCAHLVRIVVFPGAWHCGAHRLWTNGDCPDCDAEQIAGLDGGADA